MAAAVEGSGDVEKFLRVAGPLPGVTYPLSVPYCGECGLPPEFCEYGPSLDKCRTWLETHLPDEFEKLTVGDEDGAAGAADEKKRQKRGGKAAKKVTAKKQGPKGIGLSRARRGKKKMVTVIIGLATYGIDLKDAAKYFGGRFACGSSVTGDDEIVIQGDFVDDLFDILPEKWSQIDENSIDDLGEQKR